MNASIIDFNSDGKGISKIAVDNTTNVTDSGYPFQLDSGKHEDGDLQGKGFVITTQVKITFHFHFRGEIGICVT